MTITQLIAALESVREAVGDVEVMCFPIDGVNQEPVGNLACYNPDTGSIRIEP